MKKFWRFLTFTILFIVNAVPLTASASNLPDLGNEFRSMISISDERLIGDMMLREIRATGLAHSDPIINEYVKHIGNKLTPYMTMPYHNLYIKFFALNDSSINAFAFFGGHVAVHSGLILVTDSESELAGVMAHELAHISQQHVLRQMADSKRLMPVTLAESIAAIALGVPELIIPAMAGHAQQMLNFSRQHEQEADRLGLQILAKANFDPQGLPNILQRMGSSLRYHNKPPEYLLSHPLSESRIADTRSRADALDYKRKPSSNMFHLVKARLEVQNSANLHHYVQEAEHMLNTQRYNNKLAANYSYAYALLQKGEAHKAWDAISPLSTAYPDDIIIQMTAADIEVQQHKVNLAKRRLQNLLQIYPDSSAVLLQYAEVLLHDKNPNQAKKVLDKYKSLHTPEPIFYEYTRQTEGMLGNQTAVLEANAEWYQLHGDFNSALKQLATALSQSSIDKKSTKRIKIRIAELEDLIVRLKKV